MPTGTKRVIDCYVPDHRPWKRRRRCPQPNSVEILRYHVSNFKKDLAERRDEDWLIELPKLEAHGYEWTVAMERSANNKNKIHFRLHLEEEGVVVAIRTSCRFYRGSNKIERELEWDPDTIQENEPILIIYDLEILDNFILEVDIEFLGLQKYVWYPKKDPRKETRDETWAKLRECKELSDVTFVVDGEKFDLHKSVLFFKCKKLYEIANESVEGRDAHAIPIQSIKRRTFENMIKYIYTQKIFWLNNLKESQELLVAADRFECIDLKLYVESVITFWELKVENAAELMIFANSYSCALLWEAATKEYIRDAWTVKNSEAWSRVLESKELQVELLDDAVSIPKRAAEKNDNDDKAIEMMSVADLRNELQEADLALDGSRSILVKRLETHRKETKDRNDQ